MIGFNIFLFALLLCSPGLTRASWEYGAPMPTARMDAASAVVDDTLYVIGGRERDTAGTGDDRLSDIVEAYVLETDSWVTGYPRLPNPAAFQACAVVDDRIYLIGGLGPGDETLDCIWNWQPGESEWTDAATLLSPLLGAAALTLQDGTILLLGGLTADGEYEDQVLTILPTDDYVFGESPHLAQARAGAGAVLMQGIVLVTGGYFYGPIRSCEVYQGVNWGRGPELPEALGSHLSCVSGLWTLLAGGQGLEGPSAAVYELQTTVGRWTTSEPMRTPRARLAGGIVLGELVVIGGLGVGNMDALDSVEHSEVAGLDGSIMDNPQPSRDALNLYVQPNPAYSGCVIRAQLGGADNWELSLYAPTGRLAWSTTGYSQLIEAVVPSRRSLASGVYVLTLKSTMQRATTLLSVVD